ncbi:MAG: hypothetical protein ACREC8_09015, partial [Limisphaerales bacterium]
VFRNPFPLADPPWLKKYGDSFCSENEQPNFKNLPKCRHEKVMEAVARDGQSTEFTLFQNGTKQPPPSAKMQR